MQLGMLGLGRMGANIVRRLMKAGYECVVFDTDTRTVAALEKEGAIGANNIGEFIDKLAAPRAVWVMVPAAVVGPVVKDLAAHMQADDIIIDGGNSYYKGKRPLDHLGVNGLLNGQ